MTAISTSLHTTCEFWALDGLEFAQKANNTLALLGSFESQLELAPKSGFKNRSG
jgi:hypothetical protein